MRYSLLAILGLTATLIGCDESQHGENRTIFPITQSTATTYGGFVIDKVAVPKLVPQADPNPPVAPVAPQAETIPSRQTSPTPALPSVVKPWPTEPAAPAAEPELPSTYEKPDPPVEVIPSAAKPMESRYEGPLRIQFGQENTVSGAASPAFDVTVFADTGLDANFQHDLEQNPELRVQIVTNAYPKGIQHTQQTFPIALWRDATGQQRYLMRVHTVNQLLDVIKRNNPPGPKPMEAGVGASLYAEEAIESALAWWETNIDATDDTKVELLWDRTGLQSFDLLKRGVIWEMDDILGRFGRFRIKITSKNSKKTFIIDSLGFVYQVSGDDLSLDGDAVVLHGIGKKLSSNQTVSGASDSSEGEVVGFIDPISLYTYFSIGKMIFDALNPEVDLEMGGNIDLTIYVKNHAFFAEFKQAPRIRAKWFGEWLLGLQTVKADPTNVHVDFLPQKNAWIQIKSRDFPVKSLRKAPTRATLAPAPEKPAATGKRTMYVGTEIATEPGDVTSAEHLRYHNAPEWEIEAVRNNPQLGNQLHGKYHGSPVIAVEVPDTRMQSPAQAPAAKPQGLQSLPVFRSGNSGSSCPGGVCPTPTRKAGKQRWR